MKNKEYMFCVGFDYMLGDEGGEAWHIRRNNFKADLDRVALCGKEAVYNIEVPIGDFTLDREICQVCMGECELSCTRRNRGRWRAGK